MSITPRANEVAAVTGILESDAYDGPKDMGKAIVSALAQELALRDLTVVGVGFQSEGTWLPVGPFYDKRSVDRFVKDATSYGMVVNVQPQFGPGTLFTRDKDDPGICGACSHRKEMHTKFGCAVIPTRAKHGPRCECNTYERKVT